VLTLAVSGFVILMAHPRLYWGSVGNDLTPALLELPISRNYQHGGWDPSVPFYVGPASPVSAVRTFDGFNQNGWARSLHFLVAWVLALTGAVYVLVGFITGHVWRHLLPKAGELRPRLLWHDLIWHLRLQFPSTGVGPPYGLLQKCTYMGVVFVLLPLMILTGLAMSPAVSAAFPFLQDLWGGLQSARTVHFFTFSTLVLFVLIHVAMVILSGFRRQIRGMTLGH
jgi:thiosulfate reductase cytochrome b subunit